MKKRYWITGVLLITLICVYFFVSFYRIERIADISSANEIVESLIGYRKKLILMFLVLFLGGISLIYFGLKACRIVKESKLRLNADIALSQERQLLRTLIDNLPSGVFVKDTQYKKVIANTIHITSIHVHLQQIGVNTDIDILNKTDFEVFPNEIAQQYFIEDKKVICEGVTILNKLATGFDPDGNKVWLLISKVPIHDKENNIIGMVGITTDITERQKIEEDLLHAKEKAEESDRLKTSFLNNISHEIRTPLNAIIGFSTLLQESVDNESNQSNYTKIIIESSYQLLSIITDIVNIATIEAGQITINKSPVKVNSLLFQLSEQHKHKAEHKKINLDYTFGLPDNSAIIDTDFTKLTEILSNLISNAIKFTSKGHVKFGYELMCEELKFYVEDTGIGINPKFHNTIFTRFYQAENALTMKYDGTGLGLAIAKAYVELLGGKIWLSSEPNMGTTFFFTLPYNKI